MEVLIRSSGVFGFLMYFFFKGAERRCATLSELVCPRV